MASQSHGNLSEPAYYSLVLRDRRATAQRSDTGVKDLLEHVPSVVGLGGWIAKRTDDGVLLIFDMPGVSKETVSVSVERNTTLVIKGVEESLEDNDDVGVRGYNATVDFPVKDYFELREIKAKVKNGLLKVKVPIRKPTDANVP